MSKTLIRIMSYDKTSKNLVSFQNNNSLLSDEKIDNIIKEKYFDKNDKTKKFIKRSLCKFGDKYNYYDTFYTKMRNKITITCRKHGNFEQRADHHIDGYIGCKQCYKESVSDKMKILMNTNEFKDKIYKNGYIDKNKFIKIIKEKFKNFYDLSQIDYKKANDKVKLICPKHGEFWIKPSCVNSFKGCNECVKEQKLKEKKIKFINDANKKHNFYYDYSLVNYKGDNKKVCIICRKHGIFWQLPNNHLKHGCRKCGIEIQAKTQSLNINEVLLNFNKMYGNLYDYSKFEFLGTNIKSTIICKEHGEFYKDYTHHMRGQGCPCCKSSIPECIIRKYLSDNNIKFEEQKKFKNCVYKKQLRFDFYIPKINCCIEYNGKQHYEVCEHFGGKEYLKYGKIRDNIKKNYCRKNNINLFIIKYDENIIEKLEECLKKYNYSDNLNTLKGE